MFFLWETSLLEVLPRLLWVYSQTIFRLENKSEEKSGKTNEWLTNDESDTTTTL